MDWSKLMSGLSLQAMMLLAVSSRTSVLKASSSAEAFPAVVERLAQLALVAADAVGSRAAAAASLGIHEGWVVIVHDCVLAHSDQSGQASR